MHINDLETELQFAFGDARHVQQVVDQARFQFDVASNDFKRLPQLGRSRSHGFQFSNHRDDGRQGVAQFVREQREKLIFRGVGVDELVAQSDVASFIFHEIEHALNRLVRGLQAQKGDVDEVNHAAFVLESLLDQLKWRSERENALNCIGRRDLHIIVGCLGDFATVGQTAKALCHLAKRFVGLREFFRHWIDKGDADRHIGEDFLAKNHFALDAASGLGLATIKNSAKPCEDSGQHHQPCGEHGHAADEIVHRFVSDIFRLFHDYGPSGRFYRAEGIKIAAAFEIPFLHFVNFLGEDRFAR